ncbi:MAG TPA: short-chain dehydrogenase, partial [Cryomorphaceae bacterium]|nr:short-chain dehydrogenase [Cryomorphaceae bacterium]
AARAVVDVAKTGQRERMVGFSTFKTVWGNKLAPAYLDKFMAKKGFSGQLTDKTESPNREYNLWKPVPGDHGSHGDFDDEASDFSLFEKINEKFNRLSAYLKLRS